MNNDDTGRAASFARSVCERYAGYLGRASELSGLLLHYTNIEQFVRLAPIERVVQQLAVRCCTPIQLQNLLLAVARILLLSQSSSRSLLQSILAGCQGREQEVAASLLQLAAEPDASDDHDSSQPGAPSEEVTAHSAFAALSVELLRLTDEGDDPPLLTGDLRAATASLEESRGRQAFRCREADSSPVGATFNGGNDNSGSSAAISTTAQLVVEALEEAARAHVPEAVALMARAVSERLQPLDPELAYSWALRQVRGCCGSQHRAGPSFRGQDQRPLRPLQGMTTAAACACAPFLVAILGLPLLLHTAEEGILGRDGPESEGLFKGQVAGAWPDATAARDVPPVSGLLATIAALSEECEEAVWSTLHRALAVARGAGGANERLGAAAAGQGTGRNKQPMPPPPPPPQQQQLPPGPTNVRQVVAVLTIAEGVLVARRVGLIADADIAGTAAGAATGDSGMAAGMDRISLRLEALLRPLLSLGGSDPTTQGGLDGAAVMRAVQMHIERSSSQDALEVYKRLLKNTSCPDTSAGMQQQQQQQQQQHVEQRRVLLTQVQSRLQHVAQRGSACGWAAAAGPRGSAAGDAAFAARCLSDFARQGKEHLSRMAGLYKTKWIQGAKPVLLRTTLDEDAARLRYAYLKEACEGFRLVTASELADWEKLHNQLGLVLDGKCEGPARGGGSGETAVVRRPVDDLLRRLASVGPLLKGRALDDVIGALEAGLADELVPNGSGGDVAAAAAAAVAQQPDLCAEDRWREGQPRTADVAAAHVAELVLEAFVAAEEELALAAAPAGKACCRRQSHLAWQLRMFDVVSRWPQLHAPLARRLLQLATDPKLCVELDEAQVLGIAAALAATGCLRVVPDDDVTTAVAGGLAGMSASALNRGHSGAAREEAAQGRRLASVRYLWQLPKQMDGLDPRRPSTPADGAGATCAVPGPSLVRAVLGALPLGPSSRQLRFSATLLAAYLRQCALLETWALYEDAAAAGGGGGSAIGEAQRGSAAAVMASQPPAGFAGWPAVRPVWVSPAVVVGERPRWPQQQLPAGCVPSLALRSLAWLQRCGEMLEPEGAEDGTDGSRSGCWADMRRVVEAFGASALGMAMMEGWAAACGASWSGGDRGALEAEAKGAGEGGVGGEDGGVGKRARMEQSSSVGVPARCEGAAVVVAWADEAAMLQLTLRALEQGLQLPRRLMGEQAGLLLRHLAPQTQRPGCEHSEREPDNALRRVDVALDQRHQGFGRSRSGIEGGMPEDVELGALPGVKRVRAL